MTSGAEIANEGTPTARAESLRVRFANAWGEMGASWGVAPAIARVHAYLMAHGEALTGFGIVLSRRGLWSDAVPQLRRASEVDPGRASAWYYLGEALNHVDELGGALVAYERAVELEPRNAKALYGLGIVLDRLNRPDAATQMYRRSREATGR